MNGIGTDATIAQHIQKIQDRKYVTKENNLFTPTTLGAALVAGYLAMGLTLSKPELRASMVWHFIFKKKPRRNTEGPIGFTQ
jgi:DNA topoisomerase-3